MVRQRKTHYSKVYNNPLHVKDRKKHDLGWLLEKESYQIEDGVFGTKKEKKKKKSQMG